jgi:molybdopterin-binding protein
MLTSFQDTKKAYLIIQNMAGSVMKNIPLNLSNSTIEVDISSLSTGMYIMSIVTDNSVVNKKFLKGK